MNAPMAKRLLEATAFVVRRPKSTHAVSVVALAVVALAPLSLHAAGPSGKKHHRRASQSQTTTLTKSCSLKNCTITGSMFPTVNMQCPGTPGTVCTYQVHVNAQTHVSSMDQGLFRFTIDGKSASSGGTDSKGYVSWASGDPDSGAIAWDARSYTVVVDVSNNTQDEIHHIQVFVGCTDADSSGSCDVSAGFSSMTADVYTIEII